MRKELKLEIFCKNPTSERFARPWSRGKYTYSTDGKILVRIPRRDGVPENPDAPDAELLYSKSIVDAKTWHLLSEVDIPEMQMEKCPWSDALDRKTGACLEGCEEDCNNGTGIIKKLQLVKIGPCYFESSYLRMLKNLPGQCALGIPDKPLGMTKITFAGGDGLLMPCLPPGKRLPSWLKETKC